MCSFISLNSCPKSIIGHTNALCHIYFNLSFAFLISIVDEFGKMARHLGLHVHVLTDQVDSTLVQGYSNEVIVIKNENQTDQEGDPTHFAFATPGVLSAEFFFLLEFNLNLYSCFSFWWSFTVAHDLSTVACLDSYTVWNDREG